MAIGVGGAALIGAVGNIVGTGMSAGLSANEAKKQRRWAQEMSSTAYQRGMADMKLAGLNPILAYKQGGASSPTGSMAPMPNFGAGISAGMQAGAATVQGHTAKDIGEQQVKTLQSQFALNTMNALKAKEDAMLTSARQKGESMRNFQLYADLPKWEEHWKFNQSQAGRTFNLSEAKLGRYPAIGLTSGKELWDTHGKGLRNWWNEKFNPRPEGKW